MHDLRQAVIGQARQPQFFLQFEPADHGKTEGEDLEIDAILAGSFLWPSCVINLSGVTHYVPQIAGKGKQGMRLGSGVNIASVASIAL